MSNSEHFRLIVRRGPQPNQIFELTQSVLSIGRDIINDITISDPEVSRQHCQLTKNEDGYTLTDNDSTNGTFINGDRLYGSQLLKDGDTVGFGETVVISYAVTILPSAKPTGTTSTDPAHKDEQVAKTATQEAQSLAMAVADTAQVEVPELPPPPAYVLNPPGETATAPEARRVVLFGCGLLTALCLITVFMGAILIDVSDRWDDVPVVGSVFDQSPTPMTTVKSRHLEVKVPRDWEQGFAEFDDLTFVSAHPSYVNSDDLFNFGTLKQGTSILIRYTTEVDERSVENVAETMFTDYYGEDFVTSQWSQDSIEISDQKATRYQVSGDDNSLLTLAILDYHNGRLIFLGATSLDEASENEEIFDFVIESIKLLD